MQMMYATRKTFMERVTGLMLGMLVLGMPVLMAASDALAGSYGSKKSIVEIAAGNEDFSTLVAALQAADLVSTLEGEGPFTVFAPTNAAFAKLPGGTVESLLRPENRDQLIAVLTYHVVPGSVTASEVVNLSSARTANGAELDIVVRDGKVFVDDAQVVKTDIQASNGVIHVIDTVVLP